MIKAVKDGKRAVLPLHQDEPPHLRLEPRTLLLHQRFHDVARRPEHEEIRLLCHHLCPGCYKVSFFVTLPIGRPGAILGHAE
jgi:hypothetical protein